MVLSATSLSRHHIIEALENSSDDGATLDLAHKGLTDVEESGAEELANLGAEADSESRVIRVALAYNRLTMLPMAFALLSKLRYLVLKNNNFSVFPDVLTVMPSLEILDISRNKLQGFPSKPGTLVKLRVLSLQRNKIRRLPRYLTQFQQLAVLRIDHNPLEWPPKGVMAMPTYSEDSHSMAEWLGNMRTWLENNADLDEGDTVEHQLPVPAFSAEPEPFRNQGFPSLLLTRPNPPRSGSSRHVRSISLESEGSAYSNTGKLASPVRDDQPRLQLGEVLRKSTSTFPSRSPDSYLPTPEESTTSTDEISIDNSYTSRNGRGLLDIEGEDSISPTTLPPKKSLPDLRPIQLQVNTHRDHHVRPPRRSATSPNEARGFNAAPISSEAGGISPMTTIRPAPAIDVERNSYFRRFSTIKPSTLPKSIPEPLLNLVDAIRGLLFGLSQIYQTLQHYTVYAIDERLSTVLLRVLDPASTYLTQLINALDRFDSMSRRTVPSPVLCRAVVESCRDCVAVFGKTVGVLAIQLKVIALHDDVRYTRQMLLVLYGAMAEIGSSWQVIANQLEAVRPLLQETRPPPVSKSYTAQPQAMRPPFSASVDPPKPPASAPPVVSSSFLPPQEPVRSHLRSNTAQSSIDLSRSSVSRRHAGSFSYKDVELGKLLPSSIDTPFLSAGMLSGATTPTPASRATRRLAVPSLAGIVPALNGQDASDHVYSVHSRHGSQSSLFSSSASSSFSLNRITGGDSSTTGQLFDKDVLEILKSALEVAPACWQMIDELSQDSTTDEGNLREALEAAKGLTFSLHENIAALQVGSASGDGAALRENATAFSKMIIHLANIIKTHWHAHPASAAVQEKLFNLTTSTGHALVLLQISSFSPAPTPRPYSPMVSLMSRLPPAAEDGRLGANITRSRSNRSPSTSSKLAAVIRDPPHSALPHQTFSIPHPPRFGPFRKFHDDTPIVG
ncbi:hypothetical protein CERSUDRAFT_113515 [Gelatoporia subvermispora B]|uniref:RAM signaling network component n=1 Tax=Ceriporiopsis subvermispora (strain B) TaxID=914234 RepID=M2PPE1_CERS8|nr:hypothetical protein CERSUDRAFT_113515 [Gelatoporia subvermispora B]